MRNGISMIHIVVYALNNQIILGIMCFSLIGVPILGMWAVHKYNWQHWDPFDKHFKK